MNSIKFDQLQQQLAAVGADVSAAECHGSLCGALSAPGGAEDGWQRGWLERVLGSAIMNRSEAVSDCTRSLLALFALTQKSLKDDELTFQPLVPDDDDPLPMRAAALSQWCDGFVFGVALATGTPGAQNVVSNATGKVTVDDLAATKMNKETNEVLEDFMEISRVAQDAERSGDEGNEEDDAYHELLEYLRVATMLLFTERAKLANKQADKAPAVTQNAAKTGSISGAVVGNVIGPGANETIH